MVRPRIAVTMGDPAGIGPEVCLRLLAEAPVVQQCVPVIFGDAQILQRVAEATGLPLPECQVVSTEFWAEHALEVNTPAILDLQCLEGSVTPGRCDAQTGRASFQYIEAALVAVQSGVVSAVTTGPINKEAIRAAGISFPGHTEIFAAKTNSQRVCMLQTSREVTCSFVTTHIGYREVPEALSVERILDVIQLSHSALLKMRGTSPRLVVCGLNPHAGEHGLFGEREEERFIIPAIEAARAAGMTVEGPLPPDTAFLPARRSETDCFVCMYHDQGHIPLKALAFDLAVNVTLGLPVIRTSVDHGTATDIAWQGSANASSLIQAVQLATQMAQGAA